MKRMLMTTIGVLSLAVTAGAQTPQTTPQTPTPTTPPSSTASTMDKDTSLTGCLKAGSEAGSFELQRGKKDKDPSASASASGSAGAAGTAGAPSASASASAMSDKNVKLVAGAGVDLASHVGHTVQLSGSWSGAGASSASATGGEKSGRTFTVTNVKMVSATCQTGTN